MNIINLETEINKIINNNAMAVVYFSGTSCGACEVIKNRIDTILSSFPKIASYEINGEENIEIAANYQVFSLPIMLLYIEGKEALRLGRNIDFIDLEKQIYRYYNMLYN